MRKLKILTVWLGLMAYFVFMPGFVSDRFNQQVCEKISVNILDSLTNRFVTGDDVLDIILENGSKILGYPLSTIDTRKLEEILEGESFIKKAELYKTVDGTLNADILQRRPLLRVINSRGFSYYLDREGAILPVSDKFTSRVPVANGYISEPFLPGSLQSITDYERPADRRDRVIHDLYDLAVFIAGSELWRAQIAQIYVNSKYEFELIPRVGAHVIYFGDGSGYETKFRKLEALYLYGFNNEGWNNYEIINLKYENQVVCTIR